MVRLFIVILTFGIQIAAGPAVAQGRASEGSRGEVSIEEINTLLDAVARGDEAARQRLNATFEPEVPYPSQFLGPNRALGRRYYLYGASLGILRAMHFLGNMYCLDGAAENLAQCDKWHREAAARGYAPSMATLSARARYGPVKDLEQSRNWERRAAEAGDGQSMLYLAMRFEGGDEIPVKAEQAEYWYKRAEAAGMETPAVRKRQNTETVAKLRGAAAAGDVDAMYALGRAYSMGGFYGWGLEQNYTEAIRWYREAANRGHKVAANNLGVIYGRGLGVEIDYSQAMNWYRVAAMKGLVRAMYNIAAMLKSGEGAGADNATALAWYRLANDHTPADPREWPLETRSAMQLIGEPCQLAPRLTATERKRADQIYAELSATMRTPLAPSERLTGSREFQEMCEKK